MPKLNDPNDYELQDECDLAKMTVVPKGCYAPERRAGKNVALLAPDVAQVFPTDDACQRGAPLGYPGGACASQIRAVSGSGLIRIGCCSIRAN